MKVIDLIYEKLETESVLREGDYFVTNNMMDKDEEAKQIKKAKQRYENDQRLLKRLDAINNTLCESDAATYIEVEGNRLSVATARMYLRELGVDSPDLSDFSFDGIGSLGNDFEFHRTNLRLAVLDKATRGGNHPGFFQAQNTDDPMGLRDRAEEFEHQKLKFWSMLKKAVAVSDATTDVEFVF